MIADLSRDVAAIIAALLGVFAAASTQFSYWQGQAAKPPVSFGGYTIEPDFSSEESTRAEGRRERSAAIADLCESSTTSLVVGTALVTLFASVASPVTFGIAVLGLLIGVGVPLITVRKWWPLDQTIVARTEYYVMMQGGMKMFPPEEQ